MAMKNRIKGPWSEKEIKLLKKLFPIKSLIEIAGTLRRSYNPVYAKAREIGLTRRRRAVEWTKYEIKMLKKLYSTTSTWIVANKLNRSPGNVRRKALDLGLEKQ